MKRVFRIVGRLFFALFFFVWGVVFLAGGIDALLDGYGEGCIILLLSTILFGMVYVSILIEISNCEDQNENTISKSDC